MTVRDFFSCINTDCPRIFIYDFNNDLIFTKLCGRPIGRLEYWEHKIAWIYRADSTEISIRLERG